MNGPWDGLVRRRFLLLHFVQIGQQQPTIRGLKNRLHLSSRSRGKRSSLTRRMTFHQQDFSRAHGIARPVIQPARDRQQTIPGKQDARLQGLQT